MVLPGKIGCHTGWQGWNGDLPPQWKCTKLEGMDLGGGGERNMYSNLTLLFLRQNMLNTVISQYNEWWNKDHFHTLTIRRPRGLHHLLDQIWFIQPDGHHQGCKHTQDYLPTCNFDSATTSRIPWFFPVSLHKYYVSILKCNATHPS